MQRTSGFRFRTGGHLAAAAGAVAVMLAMVQTGCGPEPHSQEVAREDAAPENPLLNERTGWLRRIPAAVDGFLAIYDAAARVQGVLDSEFVRRVLANPLVRAGLPLPPDVEPTVAALLDSVINQDPEVGTAIDLAAKLAGREVFVLLPEGTAAQLRQLQAALDAIRLAQIAGAMEQLATPATNAVSEDRLEELQALRVLAALEPFVSTLEVPTIVFGFHAPDFRETFAAQWTAQRERLPTAVLVESWTPEGLDAPLERIRLQAGAMLSDKARDELHAVLEAMGARLQDPGFADRMMEPLLAREIQLAAGYSHDILLLVLGSFVERARFVPADAPEASLAASDVMARLREPAGRTAQLAAISFASRDLLEWVNPPLALSGLFEALIPAAGQLLPPESLERIATELAALDMRAARALPKVEESSCGLISAGEHWTFENFGGIEPALLDADAVNRIQAGDIPDAGLYWANRSNPAQVSELFDVASGLAGLAAAVFEADILPQLPEEDVRQFRQVSAVFRPRIEQAWALLRRLNSDVLGSESAVVLDFQGVLPENVGLPPHLVGFTSVPRLGVFWPAANPEAFAKWWMESKRLIEELAAFAPPDAGMPLALPEFRLEQRAEGVYACLPLPSAPEFDSPAGFAAKQSLGLASSATLLRDLAEVYNQTAVVSPYAAEIRVRSHPTVHALTEMLELLGKHPDAFFADPVQKDEFLTNRVAAADLIDSLKLLGEFSHAVARENGVWRRTTKIGPTD